MTGFCYAITGAVVAVFKVEMSTPTKLYSDPDPFTAYSRDVAVLKVEMSTTAEAALRSRSIYSCYCTQNVTLTGGAAFKLSPMK